jgi:8-oxo-dGTP diphosphatase
MTTASPFARRRTSARLRTFARPQTCVDVLLFTVRDFWERAGELPRLELALISRDREPFKGSLALPGTVMRIEPDTETGEIDGSDLDAARRVLRTKLGVKPPHLEQLYTWFTRDVDPRGPTTVIGYFALVPFDHFQATAGITLMPADGLPKLAFNHNEIAQKAVERIQGKASYSNLPALLMPKFFTIKELQLTYEAVTGRSFEASNFKKRMLDLKVVEEIDALSPETRKTRERAAAGQTGRPPSVFRLVERKLITFAKTAF